MIFSDFGAVEILIPNNMIEVLEYLYLGSSEAICKWILSDQGICKLDNYEIEAYSRWMLS